MADTSIGTARIDVIVDADKAEASVKALGRGVEGFSKKAEADFKRVSEGARVVGKGIGIAFTVGLAGAAVALAQFMRAANGAMDSARRATELGITVEQFSRLDYAAQVTGTSIDTLSGGLDSLQRFLVEAAKGTKEQSALLGQLGIRATTAEGNLRPVTEVLAETADRLSRIPNQADRSAVAVKLFGEQGRALLPMLRDGSKGIQELMRRSDELGYTLQTETVQGLDEAREKAAELRLAWDSLWRQTLPALTPKIQELAGLLASERMRQGFQIVIEGAGDAAVAFATLTEKIGGALSRYRDWLAEQGNLPANMLDNTEQIDERIRKLSGMAYGTGLLNDIRRGVFGDEINEELRKAIAERNALPWRNVRGGSSSTEDFTPALDWAGLGGGSGGKGGSKKGKALPDFAKDAQRELERLLETEARARDQFNAMAATLDGPLAAAQYRYQEDQAKLNELAKAGAIDADSLARAQANLSQAFEAEKGAIEAQLHPAAQLIDHLREQLRLRQLTNAEAQTAIDLAHLAVPATQAEAAEILALNQQLEDQAKATQQMDEFRRSASDALSSLIDGSKSAKEAIGDFFDELYRRAAQAVSDQLIAALFGQQGQSGGGAFGGLISGFFGGSGGGNYGEAAGSLLDLFASDGFGFASGGYTGDGPRNQPAGVVHKGEYVLNAMTTRALGRSNLDRINSGQATSAGGAGAREVVSVTNNMTMQGRVDNRTANQIAIETGRRVSDATRRF